MSTAEEFIRNILLLILFLKYSAFQNIATKHSRVEVYHRQNRNNSFLTLPERWMNACDISIASPVKSGIKVLSLSCMIRNEEQLSLRQLRPYTAALIRTIVHISLKCHHGGTFIFPWPGKIANVHNLTIKQCVLAGYNSEYFAPNIERIKSSLRYLTMKDCIILVDDYYVSNQVRALVEPVTKSADCLPLEAEVVIRNNISFAYKVASTSKYGIFSNTLDKLNHLSRQQKSQCIYENLRLFDNSYTVSLGVDPPENVLRNAIFPVLEVLNLSSNGLREIPPRLREWKLYYGNFRILDLSFNNISDISSITDHSDEDQVKKTFDKINLRYNNITTITRRTLKFLLQHRNLQVDIRNNPFLCNCEIKYFSTFINGRTNLTMVPDSPYIYFRNLVCVKPERLLGRKISSLSSEELGCNIIFINLDIVPIITLSILLSFIAGIFVTLFMFRKELVIICFTRFHIYLPCQTNKKDRDKTFDAFVAYSEVDTTWVLQTLLPRLEDPTADRTFKLCLHHRDFRLGAAIADNIVSSVEDSRHTILIISQAFLKSEWCLLEFRTALEQSLLEKKKHLIMILLENVQKKDIVGDLRLCLKTLTCIREKDRWFWEKLTFAMS